MRVSAPLIASLALCVLLCWVNPASGHWVKCTKNAYPPPANQTMPTGVVNLDLPPYQRWQVLGAQYSQQITDLIGIIYDVFPKRAPKILEWINENLGPVCDRLPQPYADEIRGLSAASGVPLGEVVLINIFYEIFTVCTSIIAQDENGNVMHGRNLDFGLFPAYNFTDHDWTLTDLLRPLLVNVDFQSGGKTIFKSIHFIGYVGILSANKPGSFAVTVDDRFDAQFDIGLIEWLEGNYNGQFMSLLLRDVFYNNNTWTEAVTVLNNTDIISPIYFIVSGARTGEGAVITREKTKSLDVWYLTQQLHAGSFYLVETNYDHWKKPPIYDNRRDPAEECLNKTTSANIDFSTLYDVLHTKPVLNKLTTYTILMSPATGAMEAYIEYCPSPCMLW